ncbi:MAG: LCP family protein, partial [Acetatifactor sp.]|nr:LCP family protein [Acetatifactor sp.]
MKKKKIFIWLAGILAALLLVITMVLLLMARLGKASLFKKASSQMPQFSEEEESLLPDREWEADWIRYQGKVYDYNENILTFLCMGIDVDDVLSDKQQGWDSGQADAIFLLVLNPDSRRMSIIAIDRNTMTDVDMYDQENHFLGTVQAQVNLAHGYGDGREGSAANQVKAVSRLMYELPIHGYCAINLPAIYILNDTIGGVDVTIPEDFTSEYFQYTPGETVHLDGRIAYFFIRYRDVNVEESARMRLERQKQYLLAFVEKAKQ